MRITRRGLLRTGSLGAGLTIPGLGRALEAAAAVRGRGTTAGSRIVRGSLVGKGYRRLKRVDGEGHLVRTDLGVPARSGRARRRRPVSCFVQLSDMHVIDVQSPLRVEYLDRYEDTESTPGPGLFGSAYRPHEMLTAQIGDAMVRRVNALERGPVGGQRIGFVVQTGDNSDNSQLNETRWNIGLLDGGRVVPDSGDLTRFEGVMDGDPATYDVHYWHPHGAPAGKEVDLPRRRWGFPKVPGLLDAARRPFRAAGLDVPWYTAFGNHDGLVQGNVPAGTSNLNAVATGPIKLVTPPAGFSPAQLEGYLTGGDLAGFLQGLADQGDPGIRQVTPDPRRRLLTRAEIVEEHFTTSGLPVGHGFTATNRAQGTAYYSFTRGLVRMVVLDTVNPNGYADGSVDVTQLAWLQAKLAATTDKLVVVCSHHTSSTMDNLIVGTGADPTPRVPGSQVVGELLKHRNVVAWVNGHTHTNGVTPHKRATGGGFWEINTASHVDWPQHARVIEVMDNRDGTLSLFGTLIDHASPLSYQGDLSDAPHLASLARELAANDWQRRTVDHGPRNGRNVELLVRRPAWMG